MGVYGGRADRAGGCWLRGAHGPRGLHVSSPHHPHSRPQGTPHVGPPPALRARSASSSAVQVRWVEGAQELQLEVFPIGRLILTTDYESRHRSHSQWGSHQVGLWVGWGQRPPERLNRLCPSKPQQRSVAWQVYRPPHAVPLGSLSRLLSPGLPVASPLAGHWLGGLIKAVLTQLACKVFSRPWSQRRRPF